MNIKKYWRQFKEKLPFVTRKWHKVELENTVFSKLQHQRQLLEEQYKKESNLVDELLKRLTTLTAYTPSHSPYELRLEMTIDPYFIEQAMMFSDDRYSDIVGQKAIASHIAHQLAYHIERELSTANFLTGGKYKEAFERMNRYAPTPFWRKNL